MVERLIPGGDQQLVYHPKIILQKVEDFISLSFDEGG
jgi:hypothetical protein